MPLTPAHLYIVLALVAASFGAGWTVKGWQVDAAELAVEQTRKAAMQGAAEAIAGIKIQNTTIRQQATTKVIERTEYRECQHQPDMMLQVNQALTGAAP